MPRMTHPDRTNGLDRARHPSIIQPSATTSARDRSGPASPDGVIHRATRSRGHRISIGTAAANVTTRSASSLSDEERLAGELRDERHHVLLDGDTCGVVLITDDLRDLCDGSRPVAQVPDSPADIVERVIAARIDIKQHPLTSGLLGDDAWSLTRHHLRIVRAPRDEA